MAYFGGTVSERPWPKIDLRFMIAFVLSLCGIAVSFFLARDLPMFKHEAPQPAISLPAAAMLVPQASAPAASVATILIADQDIPAGTRLSPSMFRLASRSVEGMEKDVVRNIDNLSGSYARVGISANTPVLQMAVSKSPLATEITSRIPSGFRAVAIPVNVLTGVEGWVRPGATVDVVWSTEQGRKLVVSTIVENAKVLSVERSMEPENKNDSGIAAVPNHITLLVSSTDAQRIQLAKGSGSLNLSLRGSEDANTVGSSIMTVDSLLNKRDSHGDIQGKVVLNGEEFILQNKALVSRKKFDEQQQRENEK